MSAILTQASREWATRPDDQRFLSLGELKAHVMQRKQESWTATPRTTELRVLPQENDLAVQVYDPTHGENRLLKPSNWSFAQLAQYAGAPASYLRKLPGELAAINLQWGLEHNELRDDALVLAQSNGSNVLRAMTSTSYGRIWDHQVVEAVEKVNADGRWQIPAASYATTNPRRATTLYASDRDVFIFLVDPKNPITVGQEELFRGFYAWNSEVGSAVFGLTTFLYQRVCDNRTIWGATDVQELRIRHTGGAPERFAYEGAKYLRRYAEEGTQKAVEGIQRAQATNIPLNEGKGDTVQSWIQARGFTKAQATASVETAQGERGQCRTVWDVVNGITAYARSVPHTDERVQLETKAGKLMADVAK
jgi:Domain of unknown function (DUF932)